MEQKGKCIENFNVYTSFVLFLQACLIIKSLVYLAMGNIRNFTSLGDDKINDCFVY